MTARNPELKFAPREIFETILEWAVIPTFDLVMELPAGGILMGRRTIAPYRNTWALPGLRMFKPEGIADTIARIAAAEMGLPLDGHAPEFLGQYVGRFKTERQRQDLSTGYLVRAASNDYRYNESHFSQVKVVHSLAEVPSKTGAMYLFYLNEYFSRRAG